MKTTIDTAGRMVIPKAIRTEMGLTPGTPVDIVYSDGRIVIEYAPEKASVKMRDGFPVIRRSQPEARVTDEMVRETLEAVRR